MRMAGTATALLLAACAPSGADAAAAGSIWICSDQREADWKPADVFASRKEYESVP